jgi:hypothetical protein
VPDGTRSLPPGFSDKNVVGRYESGKPVKGHPRTALFAVLGAGAAAGGLSQITGHKDAAVGQFQNTYIRLAATNPPQGSTVSLKGQPIMVSLDVDIAQTVPPGGSVSVEMHAGEVSASPSCVTLTGDLPGGIPGFTPTLVTAGTYSAINSACGSSFDVTIGRVFVRGIGGVYAQTEDPGFGGVPDVAIQYRFIP